MLVAVHDIITYANFGDDRLINLGMAGVKFCPFHILWLSSLQHCRTTVRVCNECLFLRRSQSGVWRSSKSPRHCCCFRLQWLVRRSHASITDTAKCSTFLNKLNCMTFKQNSSVVVLNVFDYLTT